jgi:mannose-1-phosphate guanylyltransferase/mannose-6-phosphate isomerase
MSLKILPVIMSGGSGTRLWPLSTPERPKQFHALASELSMIQETALRFGPHDRIDFLAPLVICNLAHGKMAFEQLQALKTPPAAVIQEPFGRNTAAVAVIAAGWAAAHAPGALLLLLPADHVVGDSEGFRDAIAHALRAAKDHIVTFGIQPSGPETGYGYIQAGEPLYEGAFIIARFVEKPSRPVAEAYLTEGGYFWNAGIFLYDPETFLAEAKTYCPKIVDLGLAALKGASHKGAFITLEEEAFSACPSEPIDIAVMEKTKKGALVPCDIGWADVGSWSELWRQGPADEHGNVSRGEVLVLETTDSLLWSDGPSISVIGVNDLIVIATRDHVLVLPKDRAQDVKTIVEDLKRKAAR